MNSTISSTNYTIGWDAYYKLCSKHLLFANKAFEFCDILEGVGWGKPAGPEVQEFGAGFRDDGDKAAVLTVSLRNKALYKLNENGAFAYNSTYVPVLENVNVSTIGNCIRLSILTLNFSSNNEQQ